MAKNVKNVKRSSNEETSRGDEGKASPLKLSLTMDKRIDLAVDAAIVLLGVFILVKTRDILPGTVADPITSRGMPNIGGILLIFFGIILTATRLLTWSALPSNLVPAEGKEDEEGHPASWIRAWAVILAAWLSVWLLKPLGFLLATPPFLLVFLLIMGVRSWGRLISYPIIYTLLTWYVFSQLLKVILPLGPLTRLGRSLGLTP